MLKELLLRNYLYINLFFIFSFLGWVMECLVIHREKGKFENRGFVSSPLCVIYGIGAMVGYFLLQPLSHNVFALFLGGAAGATLLEYFTALVMLHLFGKFWWDYTEKPLNYKGIICLESTIGWGFIALIVVGFLYNHLLDILAKVPPVIGETLSVIMLFILAIDFTYHLLSARREAKETVAEQNPRTKGAL